jgi:hypothetical protein
MHFMTMHCPPCTAYRWPALPCPRTSFPRYHTSKTMFFCARAESHIHPHHPRYSPQRRSRIAQGANPDRFWVPA